MYEALQQSPEIASRFMDLHPRLTPQAAMVEANRCLNCFDAPCTAACPTHIDVPRFIKKIASGNLIGSAQTILDANILGASCARVCPVAVLCEGSCVMHGRGEQPISIGQLQRHAMESFYSHHNALHKPVALRHPQKLACIGAGPASLACAAELRKNGIEVTIFDRTHLPGGLNTYGVAEYKLRAADSLREIELIRSLGVKFELGREILGEDSLGKLEAEFDRIFLGVGLGSMRRLNIPGADHPSVIDALDFIAGYKTRARREAGRRVAVIGAGNTAIDAANAARRLGAEQVLIIYRRSERDMSAFGFEYEHAKQEGVQFIWHAQPVKIIAGENNVHLLECVHVEEGRDGGLVPVPGSSFTVECETVIPAIGQMPVLDFLSRCRGVDLEGGRVKVDRATGETTNRRYFAGGDCVNGGREVVDAVADGKRAAYGILQSLGIADA